MTQLDIDGFIEWNGGEMPVPKGTIVHAKYRDGEESIVTAGLWPEEEGYWDLEDKNMATHWNHEGNCQDIVAYKLYEEEETTLPLPTSVIKGVEVDGEIEETRVVKVTDIEKEKLDKEIEEVENKLNELKSKRGG